MAHTNTVQGQHGSVGRRTNGFTLIEMLVVVAIMALLATIAMPLSELSHRRVKEEELRQALRQIRGALDSYKRLVDEGRIERAADGSGYPPSLGVLLTGVKDARSPQGALIYILRRLPRDPFAQSENLSPEESWVTRAYSSPPDNPRPGKDVFDVHSSSSMVGLNGQAYSKW